MNLKLFWVQLGVHVFDFIRTKYVMCVLQFQFIGFRVQPAFDQKNSNFVILKFKLLSIISLLKFRIAGMMGPRHKNLDDSESTNLPCFPVVFIALPWSL